MAADGNPRRAQPCLPTFPRADRRRVSEQAALLFPLARPREPGMERMIAREKCFLARGFGELALVDFAVAEREIETAKQGRKRRRNRKDTIARTR